MLRGRILLIDDHQEVGRAMQRLLTRGGYDVTVAGAGSDGLEMLNSGQWDLVLTDLFMPLVNGIDIARAALQLDPKPAVLIMSGTMESDLVPEAKALLGREPLVKPMNRSELFDAVEDALGK
jgi:DNA-binding NtrC family response regulator